MTKTAFDPIRAALVDASNAISQAGGQHGPRFDDVLGALDRLVDDAILRIDRELERSALTGERTP